jgi:hypothetical protein
MTDLVKKKWIAEQILTAIRNDRICDCITEEHLVMLTGLTQPQVYWAVLTLRRNDLIEKTGKGCYKLTSAGNQAIISGTNVHSGPRGGGQTGKRVLKDTLRLRLWRAMRIRRKFSVADILPLAVEGNERGDVTSNAHKYVRALCRAGYLTELPKRDPGIAPTSNGYKRYWLQEGNNTGPQAPVWSMDKKTVYDPNTETTHDISGQGGEA